ncbi:MAG: CRISPR-associated endonuclease Cas2 [Candidatus Thorarchaeota archaeon]
MRWIVVYDITDDSLRERVSERLKDYGLERIQYSTFQGELLRHVLSSLRTDLQKLVNEGDETDSVIIFPLCDPCFRGRIVIGAEKEMEGIGERVRVF